MNAKAVSSGSKTPAGCGRGCLVVFGFFFLLAGCIALFFMCIQPQLRARAARSWPEVPCKILSSKVEVHSDSDGTTYSPEIRFEYTVNGRRFENDRYSFFDFSSGRNWAQGIVDQYATGTQSKCYHDPQDPQSSVLNRQLGWMASLFGLLFPMIFIAVGGLVAFFGIFGKPFSKFSTIGAATASKLASDSSDDDADSDGQSFEGPQKLRPSQSRLATAIGLAVVAVIWNGLITFFILGTGILDFGKRPQWFMLLFMIPFVIAGIVLIVGAIHQALAIANPKVEIALTNGAVPLGETIDLAWQLTGRVHRLKRLSVSIEGIEKATYTRGTSTYTDKSTFYSASIFDGDQTESMEFGTSSVTIPADSMHSFSGRRNSILWQIKVRGSIPWWPDINETFEFWVKPRRTA